MAQIDVSKLTNEIKNKYQIIDNTFISTIKDSPKDKIEVEIGDSKQPDFKPQFKIMRWDNEVNFSARLITDETADEVITQDEEKIIWDKGNISANFYDLPKTSENPEGGYEFEYILKEKPKSNILNFSIETKGLNFYKQLELTQEEIDRGANRPENVVGSYAVYHKTKGGLNDSAGMEYKCGKAFHIYRPEISDSKGNKTWGELNVDIQKKLLTVTIPQKFLDEAVYPVVVDPTFGYESIGATNGDFERCNIRQLGIPSGGDGQIDNIKVYSKKSTTGNFKPVIWSRSGNNGNILTNGIGNVISINSTTAQWWTATYTTKPSATNGSSYYVGGYQEAYGLKFYYDEGQSDYTGGYGTQGSYATPSNFTSWNYPDWRFSAYATYTASASSAIKSVNGLAKASVKSVNGLAIASVKSINGLA